MTTSKDNKHPFRALVEGMTATPIEESASWPQNERDGQYSVFDDNNTSVSQHKDLHSALHAASKHPNSNRNWTVGLEAHGSPRGWLGHMWTRDGEPLRWDKHQGTWVPDEEELEESENPDRLTENHDLDWSSKNPDAGFSGTMNLDAIRSVFYVMAAKTVAQELGVPATAAVQLLDSNWGRHFCDQVNGHLRDKSAEWFSHGDAFATAIKVVLNSGPWKRDAQRALAHMKYESDAAAHPEGHYDQNAPHYQSSGKWFPGRK